MINPYESPKTPSEPTKPKSKPITGRDVGMFIGGFLSAMMLTLVVTWVLTMIGGRLWNFFFGNYGFIGFFIFAPSLIGPVCAGIIWKFTNQRRRPYANGAIVFGTAAFLFIGGCLMMVSSL